MEDQLSNLKKNFSVDLVSNDDEDEKEGTKRPRSKRKKITKSLEDVERKANEVFKDINASVDATNEEVIDCMNSQIIP